MSAISLDAAFRRLTTYLYFEDLIKGRAVLEIGGKDARSEALLRDKGATRVEQRSTVGEGRGEFGMVVALDVEAGALKALVAAAKKALSADGVLIVGCASADRPSGKPAGSVSFYELQDQLSGAFAEVRMHGQAPLVGVTVMQYGVKDPEPMLDGALVPKGERVEWYVALGGPKSERVRGYGVLPVPLEALAPFAPRPVAAKAAAKGGVGDAELSALLEARERGIEELRKAALLHVEEMKRGAIELEEVRGRVAELEREGRGTEILREAARREKQRADNAEMSERELRKKHAETEGRLLKLTSAQAVALPATDEGLRARVTELMAENEKLAKREEDARAESWKAMKARADAEAQAAEVREDTVRKLKDARKLASVELMRAMEEASKKAVTLKDEVQRYERERKEMKADLANARAEIERLAAELASSRGQESSPVHELVLTGSAEIARLADAEARASQLQLDKERLELLLEAESERARSAHEALAERAEQVEKLRREDDF